MRSLIAISLLLFSVTSFAKEAQSMAQDPALEERVNEVSHELRCLVCQNQTIADSHAALAIDLKNQVREMLAAGKSNDEVVSYMVERYGDFVRYRPPLKPTTVLLWLGPGLLLVVGSIILFVSLKNRSARLVAEAPSQADLSRAESLLQSDQEGKS